MSGPQSLLPVVVLGCSWGLPLLVPASFLSIRELRTEPAFSVAGCICASPWLPPLPIRITRVKTGFAGDSGQIRIFQTFFAKIDFQTLYHNFQRIASAFHLLTRGPWVGTRGKN